MRSEYPQRRRALPAEVLFQRSHVAKVRYVPTYIQRVGSLVRTPREMQRGARIFFVTKSVIMMNTVMRRHVRKQNNVVKELSHQESLELKSRTVAN